MPWRPRTIQKQLPSGMCAWCAQSFRRYCGTQLVCSKDCRRGRVREWARAWRVTHADDAKRNSHRSYIKHKAKHIARRQAYYVANRDHVQQYREEHQASLSKAARAWSQKNIQKRRMATRRYYTSNPERSNKFTRDWQKRHPDNVRAIRQRRRGRIHSAPLNDVTPEQLKALIRACRNRCVYCGKRLKKLTIDHITPLAKGGAHTLQNLVVACRPCNSKKHINEPLSPVQPWLIIV